MASTDFTPDPNRYDAMPYRRTGRSGLDLPADATTVSDPVSRVELTGGREHCALGAPDSTPTDVSVLPGQRTTEHDRDREAVERE